MRPRFALRFAGAALALVAIWPGEAAPPPEYLAAGQGAMEWTRRFVRLGPRPAGSRALAAQKELIVQALGRLNCTVEIDSFIAGTPVGALFMRNIIARFGPASAESVVVISGHYDTLRREGFVGANDGGSSAGLLMALAERLSASRAQGVWLVFFDGEESTVAWRNGDHTYGSRRLAATWSANGTAARLRALINVDMIGDADLQLVFEGNSSRELRERVWAAGRELGYGEVFGQRAGFIEDDHIPFLEAGVPSLNLIDFDYGPSNSYWHTSADTMDKLSPRSFAVLLHALETVIADLRTDSGRQPRGSAIRPPLASEPVQSLPPSFGAPDLD